MDVMTKEPEEKRKNKLHFYLGVVAILLSVILGLCVIVFLVFSSMLFSSSEDLKIAPLQTEDIIFQKKLLSRIIPEILQGKPEESELEFSELEVKSLFNIANNYSKYSNNDIKYKLSFDDGIVNATALLNSNYSWFFGGYIQIECKFLPEIDDNDITLNLYSIKIGEFDIDYSLKEIEQAIKDELLKDKNVQKFLPTIKELEFNEDDSLEVIYLPKELRNAAFGK